MHPFFVVFSMWAALLVLLLWHELRIRWAEFKPRYPVRWRFHWVSRWWWSERAASYARQLAAVLVFMVAVLGVRS